MATAHVPPQYIEAEDVAFDNGTDLWSVPASCSACAFPDGVKRVTDDGVSRDPAWTPVTVRSFRVVARRARGALELRVTLSRPATVRFAVRGGPSVRRKLKAGTRAVRIAGVRRGRHRVTVRVPGEPALTVAARAR